MIWFWNGSGSRDRRVNFFVGKFVLYCTRKRDIPGTRSWFCLLLSAETFILPHMNEWHTRHRIRMHSNSRDRRVTFLLENLDGIAPEKAAYLSLDPDAFDFTWILKYRKKQHARHKIRILLALGCRTLNYCTRKSDIHVTRSGFVRILDILILKLIRIA